MNYVLIKINVIYYLSILIIIGSHDFRLSIQLHEFALKN